MRNFTEREIEDRKREREREREGERDRRVECYDRRRQMGVEKEKMKKGMVWCGEISEYINKNTSIKKLKGMQDVK